jgi:uncharacterized membrane protein YphA (DoxX/SURF4 family)
MHEHRGRKHNGRWRQLLRIVWLLNNTVLIVGRFATGIIFFPSGLAKLAALSAFSGSLVSRGVPFPGFWRPVGAINEFIGSTIIILGLGKRYAAALEMQMNRNKAPPAQQGVSRSTRY